MFTLLAAVTAIYIGAMLYMFMNMETIPASEVMYQAYLNLFIVGFGVTWIGAFQMAILYLLTEIYRDKIVKG